ncbi:xanthine dehydrogenase family protein subunit M [Persicitalea sp.]|uniref:FAD binding domain-containing protein n=1 Tax=Persicitalea sp. TaxID=3100273 RepID=UPI0035930CC1
MNNFSYTRADDIRTAIAQGVKPDSAYVAGGTNLIDLMKYNVTEADALIDLNHLPSRDDITENADGGVRLSAFITNATTAYHPLIEEKYPLLSRAILAGASGQIRNMATNGGNLLQRTRCYYFYDINTPCNKREPGSGCSALGGYNRMMAILGATHAPDNKACIAVFPSDMCIALAALEAVVNIEGPNGTRSLAFEDFHRLPGDTPQLDNNLQKGEIITSLDLPAQGFAKNYSYLKIRDRNSYAFAMISVATGLELEGDTIKSARIALGGVAHKPWRVKEGEEFLKGKTAISENFAAAAEIIIQGAKGYKDNAFKIDMSKKAIIRNGMMALNPSETQLPGAVPN